MKAPRGLIDWIRSETTTVPEQPSGMERLVHVGVAPMPLTPKAFDMLIVVAIGASRAIVEAAELKCN